MKTIPTFLTGVALAAVVTTATVVAMDRVDTFSDTWNAVDGLGRRVAGPEQCPPPRPGKTVGIFYFLWLGGHAPQGPFNITETLKQPPAKRAWGPKNAFHWWDQPHFGYYLSDDEWVIAKHAQMLSDAGVDVVVFDVTNAATYEKHYLTLCKVYREIRARGGKTPQISFLFNSKAKETTLKVYNEFYAKNLYPELWFRWKGKPLLMTIPDGLPQEILDFFTIRRSWAWTNPKDWFGDGRDKWPWIDKTPQKPGWHTHPSQPEYISVASASHPVNSIGRSHKAGRQPPPAEQNPGAGIYFQEQWDHALKVDPEFVFITGWNEWVAQRFIVEKARPYADGRINAGDTWFIDQYTREYSRDIEPMRHGFEDNYYYQMVSNIRAYKGVRRVPPPSLPHTIAIDGQFEGWVSVKPEYRDDAGDTRPRNHKGFATAGPYVDRSGRNDIVRCLVARDDEAVYFYAETAAPLSNPTNSAWMNLLVHIPNHATPGWNGYHIRVGGYDPAAGTATIHTFRDGAWRPDGVIPMAHDTHRVELAIPRARWGETSRVQLEFKWIDNMPEPLNILNFMDQGDAAPNNRFRYVYDSEPAAAAPS